MQRMQIQVPSRLCFKSAALVQISTAVYRLFPPMYQRRYRIYLLLISLDRSDRNILDSFGIIILINHQGFFGIFIHCWGFVLVLLYFSWNQRGRRQGVMFFMFIYVLSDPLWQSIEVSCKPKILINLDSSANTDPATVRWNGNKCGKQYDVSTVTITHPSRPHR